MPALVSPAILATATGRCARSLGYTRAALPAPDVHEPTKCVGWRVETLRAWRPDVADRCAAILDALEKHPLKSPVKRPK